MVSIEKDPSKVHVMNNYALVEFLDDDVQKLSQKIVIIKQNNSSKLRSIYVGRIIDRPDFIYTSANHKTISYLDDLVKGKTIVAYNPVSIQVEFKWSNKSYHLIRAEDIYCKLEDWIKSEVK